MVRFNVKKLNEGDVTEQCQVTNRNKSAALGKLKRTVGTSTGHGTILEKKSKLWPKTV
jgi:hypothetical protein